LIVINFNIFFYNNFIILLLIVSRKLGGNIVYILLKKNIFFVFLPIFMHMSFVAIFIRIDCLIFKHKKVNYKNSNKRHMHKNRKKNMICLEYRLSFVAIFMRLEKYDMFYFYF
jgi:hypothetical protein